MDGFSGTLDISGEEQHPKVGDLRDIGKFSPKGIQSDAILDLIKLEATSRELCLLNKVAC